MGAQFLNRGFGWVCVACNDSQTRAKEAPRLLFEGESEDAEAVLSMHSIAIWKDRETRILECPKCGTIGIANDRL